MTRNCLNGYASYNLYTSSQLKMIPAVLKQHKAAHALTRLSNTYNIPIHEFIENDVSVRQLEYGEMVAIAETYKKRNRERVLNNFMAILH